LANKEVYRLSIGINVTGDSQAKKKISSLESATEKAEKKIRKLDRTNISPTAKLNDKASSAIDKIESKAKKFTSAKMTATAKIKDDATSGIEKIQSKADRLDKTESKVKIKAEDQASSIINKAQTKINGWIKTGAKKIISIGLAGTMLVGGLGLKSTMDAFTDFEKGLSSVQAITDATDYDMQKLKQTALDLGASTAWSASNVTQAEELLGQAGYSTQENIAALPGLLSLASAGSLDLATATDIAVSSMKAFNLDASKAGHVADVLSLSANATNSDVTDLGEAMKYIAPVANSLGISIEDTASAVGLLSNAGIKGSQAGTVLRQTLNRLASPTDTASEMIEKYGIKAFDAQGNMKSLGEVVDILNTSLSDLNSQQKADVISTIFGTESMSGVLALMNQGGMAVTELTKRLEGADGAAQKVADTKLDNLAGQMENLGGVVETMKINLGYKLAPYAKQFVSWVTDKIPVIEEKIVSLVDYISTHTGQIKAMAVSLVAVGTAFAGLSAVSKIGGIITGLKSVGGLLGLGSTAASAAGIGEATTVAAGGLGKFALGTKLAASGAKALTFMTGPAGLAIAALAITAGVAAHELKKEVVPAVDLFANGTELSLNKVTNTLESTTVKISDATKKNVGYYMEMDNKISKTLNKMKYTHQIMSEGIADYFTNNIEQMSSQVTSKLEETKSKSDKILQDMFANTNLSAEQQGTITVAVDTVYSNQQQTNDNASKSIIEEVNAAATEGREVDYSKITELTSQMRSNAITALSDTEKEAAIIQGRIKDNSTRTTTETASEIIQELEKQRQGTVDKANAEYAERINLAEQIRAQGGEKAEQAATAIIKEAERQRDETIKSAKDTKQQGIDMLKQSYADLESQVSTDTGKILSFWDRLKQWWGSNNFETKTANVVVSNPTASGTSGVTQTATGTVTSSSDIKTTKTYNMPDPKKNMSSGGYASGTNSATAGIHEVAENGIELVIGRQYRNFDGGEKVLNNGETKSFLHGLGKTQVVQPQVQVAGQGGKQFSFNMGDINIQNSEDKEQIIEQACQEFARQFREALFNTK